MLQSITEKGEKEKLEIRSICEDVVNKLSQIRVAMNTNDNHVRERRRSEPVESSRSLETIYKNAVEKRISSSSDECVDGWTERNP